MNREADKNSGFTIVELTLAMTFVSVLLIVIALTVVQIIHIYNKGLTIQQVNQAGRAINTDVRQTLGQSQPLSLSTDLCLQGRLGACGALAKDAYGGRLCTGTYTYIWNLGVALVDNSAIKNLYSDGQQIRFARVRDDSGRYCSESQVYTPIPRGDASELLASDGHLALQSFNIVEIANSAQTREALYRIVMEIGTDDADSLQQGSSSSSNLNTIDQSCRPPSDSDSLQDFCAVNHFDFTALAGNKGGSI